MMTWNKKIYIATQYSISTNVYGIDEVTYNTPVLYNMNYQPVTGGSEIALYGERTQKMYKALLPYRLFNGMFKEGDLAYIEGALPTGEAYNGANANYRICSVRTQNRMIAIYFEKIQK